MSYKNILLIAILWLGFSSQGCDRFNSGIDCDCPSVAPFFDVQNFELLHAKDSKIQPKDFQGNVDAYGYNLVLNMFGPFHFGCHDILQERKENWNISLMSSAMACSCIEPGWEGSKEIIKNITVTTANAFDADHPAGSNINDLVATVDNSGNLAPLGDFLKKNNSTIKRNLFYLRFTKWPQRSFKFKAKVKIELTNGEQYEAESTTVTFE